jgi:filamentous hemagglutinin family protein
MSAFANYVSAEEYHGTVRDSTSKSALMSANICAYTSDSILIANIVTNTNGEFRFSTTKNVDRIVVSLIGFNKKTMTKRTNFTKELGNILLSENTLLQDVVVSRKINNQNVDKRSIFITDSLRKETTRSSELLDKLNGVKADWITGKIKVNGDENVLIVVNGIKVSQDYALNINPKMVKSIDIIHHPTGKYSEYSTVVDLILKTNYEGVNLSLGTKDTYSLRNKHANSEVTFTDFTYSTIHWNLYASLNGTRKNMYDAVAYSKNYEDYDVYTKNADPHDPNKRNNMYVCSLNTGADYKINSDHVISVQVSNEYKDNSDRTIYDLNIVDNGQNLQQSQSENDSYRSFDNIVGLFYKGNFAKKLDISSELTYNYYTVKDQHALSYNFTPPTTKRYQGIKNYLLGSVNAEWQAFNQLSFSLYYSYTRRSYQNKEYDTDQQIYTSDDSRHQIDISASFRFSDKFQIRSGSGCLIVNEKNDDTNKNNNSWLPFFRVYYKPWKNVALTGFYYCSITYPNLDQLSTASWNVDNKMLHIGNPDLKPVVMHYATVTFEIDKWFTLEYLQKYVVDDISPYYYYAANSFYESYINSELYHSSISMTGEYDLTRNLHLYTHLSYQNYYRQKKSFPSHHGYAYIIDTNLTYKVQKLKLNCIGSYFLRYDKEPLLQGRRYSEEESLAIGLNRVFCRGRLSATLFVTVPVSVIPKQAYDEIYIDSYKAKQRMFLTIESIILWFRSE